MLIPVRFTLHTNGCRGTDKKSVIKYSDDSAVEDPSNCDAVYFNGVAKFCSWCKDNYLELDVLKTKELLTDIRTDRQPLLRFVIDGITVERIEEYKYLGTIADN